MKRNERSACRRLLVVWRQVLAQANHVGTQTDDLEILESLPGVRDYIIDQIEALEGRLQGRGQAVKSRPENAPFATLHNLPDNARTAGAE